MASFRCALDEGPDQLSQGEDFFVADHRAELALDDIAPDYPDRIRREHLVAPCLILRQPQFFVLGPCARPVHRDAISLVGGCQLVEVGLDEGTQFCGLRDLGDAPPGESP